MNLQSLIIPIFVLGIFLYGLHKRVDIFSVFIKGAKENLAVGVDILPSLIMLMLAVGMFRASGAMDALTELISPVTDFLGFPSECVPLALMRPVSGSGAISILETILDEYGPDSFIGRVASVLSGSTETTFYTIAVYFGATKIKRTRHALPSALAGDVTAFVLSALAVRLYIG